MTWKAGGEILLLVVGKSHLGYNHGRRALRHSEFLFLGIGLFSLAIGGTTEEGLRRLAAAYSEKYKMTPRKTLDKLAKCSPSGLLEMAKEIIKTKHTKTIFIPGTKSSVAVRLFQRTNKKYNGCFIPGKIIICCKNKIKPLFVLIHELRHAQQFCYLGKKWFTKANDPDLVFTGPLEIDANAVVLLCGGVAYEDLKRIPELKDLTGDLDRICKKHAKRIQGNMK